MKKSVQTRYIGWLLLFDLGTSACALESDSRLTTGKQLADVDEADLHLDEYIYLRNGLKARAKAIEDAYSKVDEMLTAGSLRTDQLKQWRMDTETTLNDHYPNPGTSISLKTSGTSHCLWSGSRHEKPYSVKINYEKRRTQCLRTLPSAFLRHFDSSRECALENNAADELRPGQPKLNRNIIRNIQDNTDRLILGLLPSTRVVEYFAPTNVGALQRWTGADRCLLSSIFPTVFDESQGARLPAFWILKIDGLPEVHLILGSTHSKRYRQRHGRPGAFVLLLGLRNLKKLYQVNPRIAHTWPWYDKNSRPLASNPIRNTASVHIPRPCRASLNGARFWADLSDLRFPLN